MKTHLILLITLFSFGLLATANANETAEYFICHFNHSVTKAELQELKNQGFQVFEKDSTQNVVYVKATWSKAFFTTQLKDKMKQLIMVDQYGRMVPIKEDEATNSPEFLQLFFNFI